jgi:hypothetical protein
MKREREREREVNLKLLKMTSSPIQGVRAHRMCVDCVYATCAVRYVKEAERSTRMARRRQSDPMLKDLCGWMINKMRDREREGEKERRRLTAG